MTSKFKGFVGSALEFLLLLFRHKTKCNVAKKPKTIFQKKKNNNFLLLLLLHYEILWSQSVAQKAAVQLFIHVNTGSEHVDRDLFQMDFKTPFFLKTFIAPLKPDYYFFLSPGGWIKLNLLFIIVKMQTVHDRYVSLQFLLSLLMHSSYASVWFL